MPTLPCFYPPLRSPIGFVTVKGERLPVQLDDRVWRDWYDIVFRIIETVEGITIGDLGAGALTAAQKTDLTDGGDSALHFHQADRDYADAQDAAHVAAADPHGQYLTQAEADLLYEVVGAVAAHLAAQDPHRSWTRTFLLMGG